MQLLNDIHHIAFVTADMDPLLPFYERVFDARVALDVEEEGLRHAFIEIGPHTILHPFQIPGVDVPGPEPMFERGRLDHFAPNAASEEAFREMRRRVVAAGAGAGVVTDLGPVLSFGFTDPDDGAHEVMPVKPDIPLESGLRRNWTTIELD